MPQRLTNHHRAMREYRDQLTDTATDIILAELQRLWRDLRVKLRRLDQQRPRLTKAAVNQYSQPVDLWEAFRQRLREKLLERLRDGVITLAQLEAAFLSDRMEAVVSLDPAVIAATFEQDLGLQITGIGNALRSEVSRRVITWYNKPGSTLQDITDALSPWFSEDRAEMIGRTEITRLNSNVQEAIAAEADLHEWRWMTRNDQSVCKRDKKWMTGPDGLKYHGCRELHGRVFQIGQPMPPDSSHPNCRCGPLLVVPPRKPKTVEAPVL